MEVDMFEKIAKWYLSKLLRKANINDLEMVIRSNGWTYYKRNKDKEESVKKTLSLIK
jgi:hypothetical protein